MLRCTTDRARPDTCGQETERVYSYNPRTRTGRRISLHEPAKPKFTGFSIFSDPCRTQYNLSVESNQNVESKRQSVEYKMGVGAIKILPFRCGGPGSRPRIFFVYF